MRSLKELVPQKIKNTLKHLPIAAAANILYGFPSRKLKVIAVTGTDGKTTTVNMIYGCLKDCGKKVSMISTVNTLIGDQFFDTGFHVTNPDSLTLQKFFRRAVKEGSEYIVLEVTSMGLDQYRVWGVKPTVGVITNITHEHIDYHKTFENYLKTKAKLIKESQISVLNKDANFPKLAIYSYGKIITFGEDHSADFNPKNFPLNLRIKGRFNLMNALAAAAVAHCLGLDSTLVRKSLENFQGVTGRMQEVKNSKGVSVIIDFAHTPNSLESAIKALRESKKKNQRIISVIGAEGYRDTEKRPLLGEIATKLSDFVVITSLDPRGLLDKINDQIMQGVKKAGGELGKRVFIVDERRRAIEFAICKLAKKGDIVGIFGKGHERGMNLDGKKEAPWSEVEAVERALNER